MRTFRFTFQIPQCSFCIEKPYAREVGTLRHAFFFSDREEISVSLTDNKDISGDLVIPHGLTAEVTASGQDLDLALRTAELYLQSVLSVSAFQSNATVGEVYLLFGYETTQGAEKTEFIQMEYRSGELLRRNRMLDHAELAKLAEVLSSASPSVAIALRWYRKGLTEDDVFDQFLSYWAGPEYLNESLIQTLGVKPWFRECKKCKTPYSVPSAKGINALFAKYSAGKEDDFIRCRDMSVDLRHGKITLVEAVSRVPPLTEICRAVLRVGIRLLLGLSVEDDQTVSKPVYNVHIPRMVHRGVYDIPPDNVPNSPPLQVSSEILGVSNTDEKRTISWRDHVQPTIAASYSYWSMYVSEVGTEIQLTNTQMGENVPLDE